eukprot:Opistho-2@67620
MSVKTEIKDEPLDYYDYTAQDVKPFHQDQLPPRVHNHVSELNGTPSHNELPFDDIRRRREWARDRSEEKYDDNGIRRRDECDRDGYRDYSGRDGGRPRGHREGEEYRRRESRNSYSLQRRARSPSPRERRGKRDARDNYGNYGDSYGRDGRGNSPLSGSGVPASTEPVGVLQGLRLGCLGMESDGSDEDPLPVQTTGEKIVERAPTQPTMGLPQLLHVAATPTVVRMPSETSIPRDDPWNRRVTVTVPVVEQGRRAFTKADILKTLETQLAITEPVQLKRDFRTVGHFFGEFTSDDAAARALKERQFRVDGGWIHIEKADRRFHSYGFATPQEWKERQRNREYQQARNNLAHSQVVDLINAVEHRTSVIKNQNAIISSQSAAISDLQGKVAEARRAEERVAELKRDVVRLKESLDKKRNEVDTMSAHLLETKRLLREAERDINNRGLESEQLAMDAARAKASVAVSELLERHRIGILTALNADKLANKFGDADGLRGQFPLSDGVKRLWDEVRLLCSDDRSLVFEKSDFVKMLSKKKDCFRKLKEAAALRLENCYQCIEKQSFAELMPVDFVEGFTIPDTDTRESLRGEQGLRVAMKKYIPAFSVLGVYAGPLHLEGESTDLRPHVSCQHEAYNFEMTVPLEDPKVILIDGYGYGNLLMLANDYREDPFSVPLSGKRQDAGAEEKVNAHFVNVTYRGWPFIIMCTGQNGNKKGLSAEEEIIVNYTDNYWSSMRQAIASADQYRSEIEDWIRTIDSIREAR